jgi:hypothetical protein
MENIHHNIKEHIYSTSAHISHKQPQKLFIQQKYIFIENIFKYPQARSRILVPYGPNYGPCWYL